MVGMIYGSTLKRAKAKLDEMIKYWVSCDQTINYIVNTYTSYKVNLANGEVWFAVSINGEQARGFLCNVALIDRKIPLNIIDEQIKPIVKAQPYTAIGYY